MFINLMMNDKELKTYRKAYNELRNANQAYAELHDYICSNTGTANGLTPAESKRLNAQLVRRSKKLATAQTNYTALCKRYGVVPGSNL